MIKHFRIYLSFFLSLLFLPAGIAAQETPYELSALVSRTIRASMEHWAEPSERLVLPDKIDAALDSKLRTLYRFPLEGTVIAAAYDDIAWWNPVHDSFDEGFVFLNEGIALRFDANRINMLSYEYLHNTCTIAWRDNGVLIVDDETKNSVLVSVAQSTIAPVEMAKLFQDVAWRMTEGLAQDRKEAREAEEAAKARRAERLRVEKNCAKGDAYYDEGKFKSAVYHYSRLVDSPYFTARAKSNYGTCLMNGQGTAKDLTKGFSLWNQAANSKDARGLNNLGTCYFSGIQVPKDINKAEKLYLESAGMGTSNAYVNLANMYYNSGPKQDFTRARSYALKASEAGEKGNDRILAYMYWDGQGGSTDRSKSVQYLKSCADNGELKCAELLGLILSGEITGATLDYTNARKYSKKASDNGIPSATAIYGMLLVKGLGGGKNVAVGKALLEKALGKEVPAAFYFLGELYYYGKYVEQDLQKATSLFLKSAELGYAKGQYATGSMYEDGSGVAFNMETALIWFRKASAQGNLAATKALKRLGRL